MRRLIGTLLLTCWASAVLAGAQQYEPMSASVRAALHEAVSDSRPQVSSFKSPLEAADWLAEMSKRLEKRIPNRDYRIDLLRSIHYEATRAGLCHGRRAEKTENADQAAHSFPCSRPTISP